VPATIMMIAPRRVYAGFSKKLGNTSLPQVQRFRWRKENEETLGRWLEKEIQRPKARIGTLRGEGRLMITAQKGNKHFHFNEKDGSG